jgi:hypothetical protein
MDQRCCCWAKKSERIEKTSELSGVQNEQNNDPGIANTRSFSP